MSKYEEWVQSAARSSRPFHLPPDCLVKMLDEVIVEERERASARIDTWDELFLQMAKLIARKSKDPSTQTGCVVTDADHRIRSMGYNGFPQGVKDTPERYADRDLKLKLIAHCDANAIFAAARSGIALAGCTMYLTGPPCNECMKGIKQAGIVEVIYPRRNKFDDDPATKTRWADAMAASEIIYTEGRVKMTQVDMEGDDDVRR